MVSPRALSRHRLVGIDSSIVIYAMEADPVFGGVSREVLNLVTAGELQAAMSTFVISEALVVPYRVGTHEAAEQYLGALQREPNLAILQPDLDICREAARLRAEHRSLRLPDAIHLATAIAARASAFVTNDQRLPAVPGIDLLQLSELR